MPNPIFTDLSVSKGQIITDQEAIFQSVLSLLNTKKGERFFNPEYSSDLDSIVFSLNTYAELTFFQIMLQSRILKFEPRVTQISVTVTQEFDDNSVLIDLEIESDLGKISKPVLINNGRG